MHRHRQILTLLLFAILLVGCNWPLSHPEAEPLAVSRTLPPQVQAVQKEDTGQHNSDSSSVTGPVAAFASPLATPGLAATLPIPTASMPAGDGGRGGTFSGRSLRFDLPDAYRVLEGLDGGCFLYPAPDGSAESLPGFLVLYPQAGDASEILAELLNATTGLQRTEPPLEVDVGGRTFVGLFVETNARGRLFLAAADGWALVAQGPVEEWSSLAGGLNQVLVSLSFEEGF